MEIHKNEVTALIGPSGCGKSTLIRCLNRMNDLVPSAEVDGQAALPRRRPLRTQGRSRSQVRKRDRDGVPEAEPVPEVDLRQHRLRPADPRHGRRHGRDRREGAAALGALGRGQGPARRERLRDVRRPAAAALHRPLHRHRARRDPDGRALLGPRPDLDGQDRGSDDGAEGAVLDRDRHPQHAAGGARLRPHGLPDGRARLDREATAGAGSSSTTQTEKIFTNPSDPRTEDYVSGKVG